MTLLLFLWFVIPTFTMLGIYLWNVKECAQGHGDEKVPSWNLFLCILSIIAIIAWFVFITFNTNYLQ